MMLGRNEDRTRTPRSGRLASASRVPGYGIRIPVGKRGKSSGQKLVLERETMGVKDGQVRFTRVGGALLNGEV